jgi:hypothetical protein
MRDYGARSRKAVIDNQSADILINDKAAQINGIIIFLDRQDYLAR